jgi:hypothetical protein
VTQTEQVQGGAPGQQQAHAHGQRILPWIGLISAGCVGILAIWAGAAAGLWFVPLIVAGLAGVVGRVTFMRSSRVLIAACTIAVSGWLAPLGRRIAEGQPVGATAREVASLAGLPPYSGVVIAAVILVALLQAAAGMWTGWAVGGLALFGRPCDR